MGKDRVIPAIISFLLLIWLIGMIMAIAGNETAGEITHYIGAAARFFGILILLRTGKFIRTKFFRFALFFISMVIIGSLFKIMHWPAGEYFWISGLIGIPCLYVIHFIKKNGKARLDVLKLIWVLLFYTNVGLIMFHLPGSGLVALLEGLMFCILFFDYTLNWKGEEKTDFEWLPREKS